MQMLLDKGADVNAQGGFYGNALQAASYEGQEKVVRLLLSHNTAVNQQDAQGRTPFHMACAGGHMEIIHTLISFGSDPTIVDLQERNSLLHGASKGSIEIIVWLLKEGFDPNYADRDGWTSLHWAAKNGSTGIVEVLKAAGAISKIEAIEGWTPDLVAIFHNNNLSTMPDALVAHEKDLSDAVTGNDIRLSATTTNLENERIIAPGILRNNVCDGCLMVSSGLRNFCISSSNVDREYVVYVTSVCSAQTLTTVSSAKTRQTRLMLATDSIN